MLQIDGEQTAGAFGGLDHLVGFGNLDRHRLFDQDVRASGQTVQRQRGVEGVRRQHGHRLGTRR